MSLYHVAKSNRPLLGIMDGINGKADGFKLEGIKHGRQDCHEGPTKQIM